MTASGDGTCRRRADAQRNRDAIVGAARERFRRFGVDTSLEAIAADAGVGPGTLYRNFSDREDLLAEVLRVRTTRLRGVHARLSQQGDAALALRHWLRELEDYVGLYDGLSTPLRTAVDGGDSPLALSCDWIVGATEELLDPVRSAGAARARVRGRDLVVAVLALAWSRGSSAADRRTAHALRELVEHGYAEGATSDRPVE